MARPTATPPTSCTSPKMTQSVALGGSRHTSTMPIVSITATGSLRPDSICRRSRTRPGMVCPRNALNTAAASVDATTAPISSDERAGRSKARAAPAAATAPVTTTPTVANSAAGAPARRNGVGGCGEAALEEDDDERDDRDVLRKPVRRRTE